MFVLGVGSYLQRSSSDAIESIDRNHRSILDNLKDRLIMTLFILNGTISTDDWKNLNAHYGMNDEHISKKFKRELKALMIGLDSSGKTTILYKYKLNEVLATIPTIGFNVETISFKNFDIIMWDIGCSGITRVLWKHYYQERLSEASEEFYKRVVKNEELASVPILILANKQDLPNVTTVSEIIDVMNLHSLKDRKWYVQGCCATTGDGLYEALDWIIDGCKEDFHHISMQPSKIVDTTKENALDTSYAEKSSPHFGKLDLGRHL